MLKGFKLIEPDEFRTTKAISNTRYGYLEESPHQYQMGLLEPYKDTAAKKFGRFYHCYILEPHEIGHRWKHWTELWEQRPNQKYKMGSENEEWIKGQEELLAMAGIEFYTDDMLALAGDMREALWRSPAIWGLVEIDGQVEQPYLSEWHHPENGDIVRMKGQIDKRIPSEGLVFNLKTAASASPNVRKFPRQAFELGYHRNAAMVLDADHGVGTYLLVVQEKSYPYEPNVFYVDRNSQTHTLGRTYGSETLYGGRPVDGMGYDTLNQHLVRLRRRYGSEYDTEVVKAGTPYEKTVPARYWPGYGYWIPGQAHSLAMFDLKPPPWFG